MYLQKLFIHGFKSFANKTMLEFTPGVTAVVGPNGSGKSNIADAVRWVLGEQSLKTLRGKKSGDVIFAGSDRKARLGYCQVDMHLNNDDHKAPVDFSEIVISRKIFRDGEGEYFINKNRVRLQDILLLLAKSNFGQRSYSIISQGMVDLFLAATPTQRKEYFDEAAGVRQFQIKKEQAENKLEQTKENIRQAGLLIQEIEPRLRSLTRQVHRLEKQEEISKQLKEVQHQYYAGLWHELKNKHEQEEQRCQAAETQRKNAAADLEASQKKIRHFALGSSRQDEFQSLQREYNQEVAQRNTLLQEQAVLKGKIDIQREQKGELELVWLERKKEQLEENLKNLRHGSEDNQKNIFKWRQQLDSQQGELQKIAGQHQKISKNISLAKDKLAHRQTVALPEVAKEIESLYNRQKALLAKIESAQTPEDLRQVKAEAKALTDQLAQLHHRLKGSGTGDPREIIAWQDEITQVLTKKDGFITVVNDLKIKLQVAKEKDAFQQKQIAEFSGELEKANKELARQSGRQSAGEYAEGIKKEAASIAEKIKQAEVKLKNISEKLNSFNQVEQQKKEEVFSLQNTLTMQQTELDKVNGQINATKIELAKLETKQEDLEKEMIDELKDEERNNIYKTTEAPAANPGLFAEIQKLKKQIELIGGIDPQVSQEYRETKTRYDFLTQQSEDLNKALTDLETAIASLEETIKKQFTKSFDEINRHFTQYFKILFNGGNASLSLVKEEIMEEEELEEDEESEDGEEKALEPEKEKEPLKKGTGEKVVTGIDIHATPPGKRLKGINMLSGGERALTSIALICAIIHNNPSPFVILDEVDAALDEFNSIRFAAIFERLSKKTQFIVITHNRATMNKAHTLYGVTMGDDGVSRLLSINMEEAEKVITDNK